MVSIICIVIGLTLISFGLYLKRKGMEKNPRGGVEGFMAWTFVDTFFWLCLSSAILLGGLTLFAILVGANV